MFDDELANSIHRYHFVSAAQRSEREDVRLEKDLQLDHFKTTDLKEQLKQKGVYLSYMQQRKKNTDHCKSLLIYLFIQFFKKMNADKYL